MGWAYFSNGSAIDKPYYNSKAYLRVILELTKGYDLDNQTRSPDIGCRIPVREAGCQIPGCRIAGRHGQASGAGLGLWKKCLGYIFEETLKPILDEVEIANISRYAIVDFTEVDRAKIAGR